MADLDSNIQLFPTCRELPLTSRREMETRAGRSEENALRPSGQGLLGKSDPLFPKYPRALGFWRPVSAAALEGPLNIRLLILSTVRISAAAFRTALTPLTFT